MTLYNTSKSLKSSFLVFKTVFLIKILKKTNSI